MESLYDQYKITPKELIDSLSDGPRSLLLNPSPDQIQDLLSEIYANQEPD